MCSVDLEIWGDLAHVAAENLEQGDQLQVIGRLKKGSWIKRDGTERQEVSVSLTKINRIVNTSQDMGDIPVSPTFSAPPQTSFINTY